MMVSQRFSNSYDNSCSNIIVRPNKYIKLNCNPPLKNIFIPNKAEMNSDKTYQVTGSKLIKVYNTNTFECLNCHKGEIVGMSLTQLRSHVNNTHEDCCFSKVRESVAKYTDDTIHKEINNNERSKTEIIQYSKNFVYSQIVLTIHLWYTVLFKIHRILQFGDSTDCVIKLMELGSIHK